MTTYSETIQEWVQKLNEVQNIFSFASDLMHSLVNKTISSEDYDTVSNLMFKYCKINNISTENEICSL